MQKKFKNIINNNGLSERDRESVQYALKSKSPKDALRRADLLLDKSKSREIRLSYYSRLFLKALAISAEFDIASTQEELNV